MKTPRSLRRPKTSGGSVLERMNRREGAVGVRTEDVVFLQIDDVLAVDAFELGKDCRARHDLGARFDGEIFNGLQRLARGNHVVDDGDALAADLVASTPSK